MKKNLIILSGILIFAGCGGVDTDSSGIETNVSVSECGGFEDREVFSLNAKEETTCDQLIIWKYDETEKVLNIVNQDVLLNCCGEHDVEIKKTEDGKIEYTMIDNSMQGARCDCMCHFDYSADIKNVSGTEVNLSVFTDVEENEGPETVWEGTIDLSEGSGTIVVKERSGDNCW